MVCSVGCIKHKTNFWLCFEKKIPKQIVEMALYDNKYWLLSHIRNSFISTDDTGYKKQFHS